MSVTEHRQEYDVGTSASLLMELSGDFKPGKAGHGIVENGKVGYVVNYRFEGTPTVTDASEDFETTELAQGSGNGVEDQIVVVGEDDGPGLGSVFREAHRRHFLQGYRVGFASRVNAGLIVLSSWMGLAAFLAAEEKPFVELKKGVFEYAEGGAPVAVEFPHSLQASGLGGSGIRGSYRFSVMVPEGWRGRDLAVSTGVMGNVGEVLWNGQTIGMKGDWKRLAGFEWQGKVDVFRIDLPVHWGEENALEIRVGCFFGEGGILADPPAVGDYAELRLGQIERSRNPAILLIGQLALYAAAGMTAFALILRSPRDPAHWFFLGFFLGEAVPRFLSGLVLLDAIRFSFGLWQLAVTTYWGLYMGAVLMLARQIFVGETSRRAWWCALTVTVVAGVTAGAAVGGTDSFVSMAATAATTLLNLIVIVWVGLILWRAVRDGERLARWMLLVWLLVIAGFSPDVANYFGPFVSEVDRWTPWSSWTGLLLVGSYGYLLIDRLVGYKLRARRLAGHVFSAKEEERARIARDLHDGIAREVFAVRKRAEECGQQETASELAGIVEEIRRVAHELHPRVLGEVTLEEACRSHVEKLAGADFSVDVRFEVSGLGPALDGELYRIFQEFVENALHHGSAERVEALLSCSNGTALFELRDDGGGRPPEGVVSVGLGTISVSERIARIGGHVRRMKGIGRGEGLAITFPLPDSGKAR